MKRIWIIIFLICLAATAAYAEEQIPAAAPVITNLSPAAGLPGDEVKIEGTGFSKENNTVTIRNMRREQVVIANLKSEKGTELVFQIPAQLNSPSPFERDKDDASVKVDITPGFYDVFVDNVEIGKASNVAALEVRQPGVEQKAEMQDVFANEIR